jgi:hypothetical protein
MNTAWLEILGKDTCNCIEYRAKMELRDWYSCEIDRIYGLYTKSLRAHAPYTERALYMEVITEYKKKIKSLTWRIDQLTSGKEPSITPDMIDRAKNYPIDRIVDVVKNKAICPNHEDTTPSMDTRNNFAYCYVCGYRADTIQLYRDINKASFSEAVKALQ